MPLCIRVSASTACQLRCPNCNIWPGSYCQGSSDGFLKATDFEKFLQLNPFVRYVELSHTGEIFLNPDLAAIIEIAAAHRVELSACGGCNFNSADEKILKLMVKTGFRRLHISLDGPDQKSYATYRRRGQFKTVIANIKKLNALKKKHQALYPQLQLDYVILPHNHSRSQLQAVKKLAQSLDATVQFFKDYRRYVPTDKKMIAEETGLLYDENEIYQVYTDDGAKSFFSGQSNSFYCSDLWKFPQINIDGRFLGCCCNSWQAFDTPNAFEQSLRKILHSRSVKATKKMLRGGRVYAAAPCIACKFYKMMLYNHQFLRSHHIKATLRVDFRRFYAILTRRHDQSQSARAPSGTPL